jgi:hypothetical protein
MSGHGLIQRMKSWFGGKRSPADSPQTTAKRYTLGPPDDDHDLAMDSAGAIAASMVSPRLTEPAAPYANDRLGAAPASAGDLAPAADDRLPGGAPARLEPLDPTWMKTLEDLPSRIAESMSRSAAGLRNLENMGAELEGHRHATRSIADSVRRQSDLAAQQTDLSRQANKTLERQALVAESTLDALTELRAAFRTVEESSRRHLKAIAQLEYGHRQILYEYQDLMQKTQSRLARLSLLGVVLGVLALAGVGVALYRLATVAQ